ncbi:MAG TPA: hypothetical protein VMZ28_12450 [Kofleriaceae bacterium]|nr:hypothetical protein [Kofleriaceae bacterium]
MAVAEPIGILGLGTSLAKGTLPPAALARLHGVTEEDAARVLGGARVFLSDEPGDAHAVAAARACLAQAGVAASEIDCVMWASTSKRRAPFAAASLAIDALGATEAFGLDLGSNCSELLTGMRFARAMLRDDPSLRHVLLLAGEQWRDWLPGRSLEPLDGASAPNVMSDGGAAVLVGRTERRALVGFGFATHGRYHDLAQLSVEVEDGRAVERNRLRADFPRDQQLALDLTRLFRKALGRCLTSSGLERTDVDHLIFPFSPPGMQAAFARALGLAPEKLVQEESAPTHIGAPDLIHGLEILERSGRPAAGQRVLLGARSIGIMRFAVIRL